MFNRYVAMWDEPDNDAPEGTEIVLLLRPYGEADAIDAIDVVGPDNQANRHKAIAQLCESHSISPRNVIDESVTNNGDIDWHEKRPKSTSQQLLMKILVYLEKTQSSVFVSMNDEENDGNHEEAESLQKQHDALDKAIDALQAFQKERGDL